MTDAPAPIPPVSDEAIREAMRQMSAEDRVCYGLDGKYLPLAETFHALLATREALKHGLKAVCELTAWCREGGETSDAFLRVRHRFEEAARAVLPERGP